MLHYSDVIVVYPLDIIQNVVVVIQYLNHQIVLLQKLKMVHKIILDFHLMVHHLIQMNFILFVIIKHQIDS